MKHVGEPQPAAEIVGPPGGDAAAPLHPERSPDQDDFNESLRAGMRSMAAVLRSRRKQK